jgi:hypothetical protein
MPLFGPPNVEKLRAKGDVIGLIKAFEMLEPCALRDARTVLCATRRVTAMLE